MKEGRPGGPLFSFRRATARQGSAILVFRMSAGLQILLEHYTHCSKGDLQSPLFA